MAVAEVADQEVARVGTEAGGGYSHAPGRIKLPVLGDALEQVAAGVEDVHESLALAGHRTAIPGRVLLGVGDVQVAAQILNVERRKPIREVWVDERPGLLRLVELAVDHVDLAVMEVGGVQEVRRADVSGGEARVDSPVCRLEAIFRGPGKHPEGSLDGCSDTRVPAGDRPGLRGEDKHR